MPRPQPHEGVGHFGEMLGGTPRAIFSTMGQASDGSEHAQAKSGVRGADWIYEVQAPVADAVVEQGPVPMTSHFLDNAPRFLFFTGKGGVGKTSVACAAAVRLADGGRRVLLVSTDPASNIGQVFGVTIGNTVTAIPGVPQLDALEIDPEQATIAYRERILAPVRGFLPEDELASVAESLSGSCTTEIASFDEFTSLLTDLETYGKYEHVLFDTAPTGHTLRLLQLPGAWTDFLQSGGDASCLGPLAGLDKQRATYAAAVDALSDAARTRLVLVTRAQQSTLDEAGRTFEELSIVGMTEAHLVVNGVLPPEAGDEPLAQALRERERAAIAAMPAPVSALPRDLIALKTGNVVGIDAVRELLTSRGAPTGSDPGSESVHVPEAPLVTLVDEIEADGRALVMCMGKGGVGKTTIAAALAVALATRGHDVLLTTTDPAAHLTETLNGSLDKLTVTRIDPMSALAEYQARVMATKGKNLDDADRAALAEDLRSPCTEEVAVFQQFSRAVHESRHRFVIMDTAPTGHTVLLLDTAGAYHRESARQMGEAGMPFTTPLMRMQDPQQTKVVLVTLPETTPVLEAAELQADLERAGIHPWAWVVNNSIAAAKPESAFLHARAVNELPQIARVSAIAPRMAIVPVLAQEPTGVARLSALAGASQRV